MNVFFVLWYFYIMVDHALIDNFNLKARDFAIQWKNKVRKVQQLKHYNEMDDEELVEKYTPFFPALAKILDRGADRNRIGSFFANLGKVRMQEGFPISEVIYALSLLERVLIEYISTDYAPENPVKMYQSMGAVSQISEFFLLGCFYITKGYLEAVYTGMNIHDSVSEELLKKYFKDDFFFKDEQPG